MKTKLTKMQYLNLFFQTMSDDSKLDAETEKQIKEFQNKLNSKNVKKMKGRKTGTGHVIVNGRVMTQQMYKDAAINAIKELTNGDKNRFVSAETIVAYASNKMQMDTLSKPRRANSHPMWRILTNMIDDGVLVRRVGLRGVYEYRVR